MDTKSKKFDRSIITKTICFLLAMLFAALGTASSLRAAREIEESEANRTYFQNIFVQGKNFDLFTSTMFETEYEHFMEAAIEKALVYGDGSKKAFDEYTKKFNEYAASRIKDAKKELKNDLLKESGTVSYFNIFKNFSNGAITLEKIGDHKTHTFSSGTYVFDADEYEAYFRADNGFETPIYSDGGVDANSSSNYPYDDDEYEDYSDDEDSFETTTMPITAPQTTSVYVRDGSVTYYYDYDGSVLFSFTKSSGIPQKLAEQNKDCDGIIEICRASVGGAEFDGYYKFNINEACLIEKYLNYPTDYTDGDGWAFYEKFRSYSAFKEKADENAKDFARYKNLSFAIVDNKTGKILLTTLDGTSKNMTAKEIQEAYLSNEWSFLRNYETGEEERGKLFEECGKSRYMMPYNGQVEFSEEYLSSSNSPYTVMLSFDNTLSKEDVYSSMGAIYENTYAAVKRYVTELSFYLIGFLICVVILIIRSGRKHGDDEIHMMPADRIFTILRTAINGFLIAIFVGAFWGILDDWWYNNTGTVIKMVVVGCSLLSALAVALLIDWLMYLARHIKNHTLVKNIFIIWLCKKIWALCKKLKNKLKNKIADKKAKWQARPAVYRDIFNDVLRKVVFFVFAPNLIVGLIVLFLSVAEWWFFAVPLFMLLAAYDVFVCFYIVRYAYSLRKIFYALNQIRGGNYDVQIDQSNMPQSVKAYANDVTALKDGLKLAVENAVKEQRTKTELITNVSHDLKTPLTSIITYVDLLSRCEIEDETANGYIEVLGEKSARLKRLIEDLVEASKAQAGSINVNLIKVSLKELTSQVAGEYEDELAEKNLSVVLTLPEEDIIVEADSRMCYRVLDNLMNNVKKYAMGSTRVYVDVFGEGNKGIITIRNISESQLNIAPEELMARFVRGDSSRSTEGSGLGLSIAENFCRLQGGKLSLEISGDLFTARVEYRMA